MDRFPLSVRAAANALRALTLLLPKRLRARHGRAMESFFRELAAETQRTQGALGVWKVWSQSAWDLVQRAPGEHILAASARRRRSRMGWGDGRGWVASRERGMTVDAMWQDLRLAVRSLVKRPGTLAVTTITLALGLGANTAVFSVLWGAWLKPVPYPNADRLVWISDRYDTSPQGGSSMSLANFLDLERESRLIEDMVTLSFPGAAVGEDQEWVTGMRVDPGFFRALGMPPVLGRGFLPEEGTPGKGRVVVVSYGFWSEVLGGAPDVLGSPVLLDGHPFTVVGVASPDFRFRNDPRFFVPTAWTAEQRADRSNRSITGFGLLAPGVKVEEARAELESIFGGLADRYPEANQKWNVSVAPLKDFMVGAEHTLLAVMGGAALLVLMVAVLNVASILLARAQSRQREMAVRAALGAGHRRIVASFLTEGLVVAVVGGAVGLWVAHEGTRVLLAIFGGQLRRASEIGMSWPVTAAATALTLVTGLAVAVAPAWHSRPNRLADGLKDGAPSLAGGGGRLGALVVFEVAMAVTLVTGAALLVNTMWRLSHVDVGVDTERTLIASVAFSGSASGTSEEARVVYRDLETRVEALPGVVAAGLTNVPPLDLHNSVTRVTPGGQDEPSAEMVLMRYVTPDYFAAVGMRLLAGRTFAVSEVVPEDGAAPVVISEPLARTLFPDGDAVGRTISRGPRPPEYEVVGVVAGVRERGPGFDPRPAYYLPYYALGGRWSMHLAVRADGDPIALMPVLRSTVASAHPGGRLGTPVSLGERVRATMGDQRFALSLIGLFALQALALGAVGVYGVTAFTVARRTREMGLRLALGASRASVMGLVLRQGVRLTLLGLALGLAATVVLSGFIRSLLFEVSAADPMTFGMVAVVLLVTAVLACLVPARRAAGVPLTRALQDE